MSKKRIFFQPFIWTVLIILSYLLFRPAFSSYFFQDDWFSLSISKVQNISDLLTFFIPRTDLIYYRPLGMQLPFFLFSSLFGLNPLPFRIATLVFHVLNGFLAYKIINIFLRDKTLALYGAAFYLLSAVHQTIFYWAATIAFVMVASVYFGSLWLYLKDKTRISFLLFGLGVFINELIITLPLILTIYEVAADKKRRLLKTLPYWCVSIIYALFRLSIAKFPTNQGYAFVSSVTKVFLNLRNYWLWSLNWPEETANQFLTFWKLNSLYLSGFISYLLPSVIITIMFIALLLGFSLFLYKWKKLKNKLGVKQALFAILWFFITLSPVLFYERHYFAYYLPIPLVGLILFGLITYKLLFGGEKKNQMPYYGLLLLILLLWYVSAWQNIRFSQLIYWAPKRAILSYTVAHKVVDYYPNLPHGAIVFIQDNAGQDELRLALGEQNGVRTLYNDSTLTTFFGTPEEYFQVKHITDEIERKKLKKRFFIVQ